jgi:preprotein translocase SecE subunit
VDRIRGLFARARRFIDEAWSELKKVSWPTVPQTRNLTVLVFTVSFVVMLFIAFWDTVFLNAVKILSGNG